jgi:hypothetical protein
MSRRMKEVTVKDVPMETPSVMNPGIKAVASEITQLPPNGGPESGR